MQNEPWIVTLDTEKLWVAIFAALALVLVALLLWSGRRRENPLEQLGREWLDGLYVVVGLFFLAALGATAVVLFDTFRNVAHPPDTGSSPNLGAGALIAAILGAPFVIWGTVLKHQTLRYTKEGHITDRISKAVEQLGAEKKVDRIGRPVTLLSGEPGFRTVYTGTDDRPNLGPEEEYSEFLGEGFDKEGLHWKHAIKYWPERRTVIEWRGESLAIGPNEKILERDKWQLFSESQPNIEVRIGGLLSLERISQDSVKYDQGRDHVRIMEILCAYVRNNAPASSAQDVPGEDPEDLQADATEEQLSACNAAWKVRNQTIREWLNKLPKPREDIQLALSIIGRREPKQRQIEAGWGAEAARDAEWVFDTPFPETQEKIEIWNRKLRGYRGYRPDLRGTNLQKADLRGAYLSGALLKEARLQGANLSEARLVHSQLEKTEAQGTVFVSSVMRGARLRFANCHAAEFRGAELQEANLFGAILPGAYFNNANMDWTDLMMAQMQGATLVRTRLKGADLSFTQLRWAVLRDANFSDTDLLSSQMEKSCLSSLSLVNAKNMEQGQLESLFADGSVTLPPHLTRPAHWPVMSILPAPFFRMEYQRWLANPETYTPPPPAAD